MTCFRCDFTAFDHAYLCTGTHQIAMSAIATETELSTFQADSHPSAHVPLFGLCTTETSIQEIGTLPL